MTTIFEHAVMNGIHAEPISRYCDEGQTCSPGRLARLRLTTLGRFTIGNEA